MISIGIDPGVNGGIAIIDSTPQISGIEALSCPATVKDMADIIDWHKWECIKTFAVIEKVHSCLLYTSPSPRDRQKSRMPSSA